MNLFELFAKLGIDTSEYEAGLDRAKGIASTVGSGIKTGLKVAGTALVAAGSAAVAFGATSVKAGMDFDKSMSQVAATMGTTVEEIDELREFAQEMGRTTAFSATQAADALNYMALAGYDAETSMSMLPNVLNLAAAGSIDLAAASDMITDAQSALGLSLEDTTEMVDKMAKASSKSNTSVAQLGEAILTVGGTAKNIKGGTTEIATVLGILADNGIKGAEGGTALRNILNSLTAPTNDAANLMHNLGLSIFDAEGNMRSMNDIFIDLRESMDDMTQEGKMSVISTLFNARDMKSANALLANVGDRFEELSGYIEDANGAAQAMAETQLDNLAGDITLFQSALEGAKIAVSDSLTPTIREFVQFGTDGLSKLTEGFKTGGLSGAMNAFSEILEEGIKRLVQGLPKVVEIGSQVLTSIINGITKGLPKLTKELPNLVRKIVPALSKAFGSLLDGFVSFITDADAIQAVTEGGIELAAGLAKGILTALPKLLTSIPNILTGVVNGVKSAIHDISLSIAGVDLSRMKRELEDQISGITSFKDVYSKTVSVNVDYSAAITSGGRSLSDIEGDINDIEGNITKVLKDALQERGRLRDDEIIQIKSYLEELENLNEEKLSIYRDQQLAELRKIQLEGREITSDAAAQHLRNARELYEASNKEAEDYYTKELGRIENLSKAGAISPAEYEKRLAEAKKHHDDMINENKRYFEDSTEALSGLLAPEVLTLLSADRLFESGTKMIQYFKDGWGMVHEQTNPERLKQYNANFKHYLKELEDSNTATWLAMVAQSVHSGNEMDAETEAMLSQILVGFATLPDELEEEGKGAILKLIDGLEEYFPELEDTSEMSANEIKNTLWNALHGGKYTPFITGNTIIKDMIEGAKAEESSAKRIFESIGGNVLQSFANSISSNDNSITRAIKNSMGKLVQGAKDSLGIKSPSKVAKYLGQMFDEGFAIGIDSSADDVVGSVEDMTDLMQKNAVGSMNISGNGLTGRSGGVIINVYGAEGQDVSELAEIVSQKIAFNYDIERRAFA